MTDYPHCVQCSFGTPNCGTHGTQTADCSCTCATGWTTYAQQDLANYMYCTIATTSSSSNTSSTNSSTFLTGYHEQCKLCHCVGLHWPRQSLFSYNSDMFAAGLKVVCVVRHMLFAWVKFRHGCNMSCKHHTHSQSVSVSFHSSMWQV